MTPATPAPADAPAAGPFDNRSLFSDHYLSERLPEQPVWQEDVDAAWTRLRALYDAERGSLEGLNEGDTEQRWVRPVLNEVLGWHFIVQTRMVGVRGRANHPDYTLFATEAERRAADAVRKDERAFYARAAAVAEAKYWGRPLDQKVSREVRDITNTNPSFQIVSYLMGSGVEWGILTNGAEWRLYTTLARSRVDTYYAVDVRRLLEEDDREGFRYFYFFFRAAAFRPDDATGRTFLRSVLDESETYARELERRLKDLIFDEIFPHLARGFVTWRRENGGAAETDESLREIYAGTLRLLYRLLFLLHAESRALLPTGPYSLTSIKRAVKEWRDRGETLSDVSDHFWNDLAGLFRRVDRGDPRTGMPRYNGGLFREDAPRNRFLREHRMADAFLAPALDLLARAGGTSFIDYKALSVEQLGSVYEGLLEFRLRLDEAGMPFLVNDKGERKATGSYYTPQYVVEYIVAEAVGPVLEERVARFRALMEEVVPLRGRLARAEAGGRESGGALALRGEVARLEGEAVDALLGIRVCDPAMGSGHFLVHATDWLTERLMVVLNEFPENPVLARIAQVRAQIVENLGEQGITVDPEHLKDTNLLKRMVMKQCIYGVDLNPMATELAKLALWLDSFTVGAPLSFLDHHLKTGNSLVGMRVDELRRELESGDSPQFDAFGGPFAGMLRATKMMREVASLTDATFEEVALSSQRFGEYEEYMRPYKQLLNLWVARHFAEKHKDLKERGELMVRLFADEVLEAARGRKTRLKQYHLKALASAEAVAGEQAFFHWELEFPEVFVDLDRAQWKENPGFDAVIGNPPYVRGDDLGHLRSYFSAWYGHVYSGSADLFVYFFAQGTAILRREGELAFIASNTWLRGNYATGLRRLLRTSLRVRKLIELGDNRVFADAPDVYPVISVVRNSAPSAKEGNTADVAIFNRGEGIVRFWEQLDTRWFSVTIWDQPDSGWQLTDDCHRRLFNKLGDNATPLADVVGDRLYRGILTGRNNAFILTPSIYSRIVSEDPSCKELLKPVLRGEDLRPWCEEWEGHHLVLIPHGWTVSTFGSRLPEAKAWELFKTRYPSLAAHLAQHESAAKTRGDKGQYWWELRSCDYYGEFTCPKIFWPDIAKYPRFSMDTNGFFSNDKGFFAVSSDRFVLGVLQSRVLWFYISQLCVPLGERAGTVRYQQKKQFIARLPIPTATDDARNAIASLALDISECAAQRVRLQGRVRGRVLRDLGPSYTTLKGALAEWWKLDFTQFRAEVKKSLKREVPLRERDEWEEWLDAQKTTHADLTAEIVRLERLV